MANPPARLGGTSSDATQSGQPGTLAYRILSSGGGTAAVPLIDVELTDVCKAFGAVAAVNGVSLSVRRGEVLTLLGPSGCGKSTILRMVAGLEEPTSGTIRVRGALMNDVAPYRRNLGMVFQSYGLFPHMTVYENIAFGLRMHRTPAAQIEPRVRDAIERVGLAGKAARRPRELSGGEQQRVALARSIVTRPTVLLLDEPFGALDRKLRERMHVELKQLQEELGITTIFVTHDQEEALALSDRIAVMSDGRVQQIGSPTDIYAHPQTRFVADFVGLTNILPATVVAIDGPYCTVATADKIRLLAAPNAELAVGQSVDLAIRPERIVTGPSTCRNQLRGRVVRSTFLGAATLLWVECGPQTLVRVLSQGAQPDLATGAEVNLALDPDHTAVLPS